MSDSIPQRDHGIRELGASRPLLRHDLRYSCRELRGETLYLMEDPLTGKFYHLGEREYRFCKLLDGRNTLVQAIAKMAAMGDEETLSENLANSLLRRYQDAGLIQTASEDHAARRRDLRRTKQDTSQVIGKGRGLMMLKIPLGSPDVFLTKVDRWIRPIRGECFFFLWLLIVLFGAASIASQWDRFTLEARGVMQLDHAFLLAIVWLLLKVVHEFFHGITCKRFGGTVPEAGVTMLLLVTPLGYVDASSSLRFPSKGQRMLVAAAGMLGELFVAAIAGIIWAIVDPGPLGSVLHQVIIISSVTTILFNANPLMRFDGYYILSDLLDVPNLSHKGSRAAKWLFNRLVLGVRKASFPLRALEQNDPRVLITVYGVAAAFWKVTVTLGLMIGAAFLFRGAGLILAIAVGLAMLAGVIRGLHQYLKHSGSGGELSPMRVATRVGILTIGLVAISLVPVRPGFRAAGIVEPIEGGIVRADCPGFVREILIENGVSVKQGDRLATLENSEATVELVGLRLEVAKSRRRMDLFHEGEEIAAYQSERKNLASLEERLVEMEAWTDSLILRAPIDGTVEVSDLDGLLGNYLRKGDVALTVVGAEDKLLRLLVPQDHVDLAGDAVGRMLRFRAGGSRLSGEATLEVLQPQAILHAPHPGMTTVAGGPLVVRQASENEDRSSDQGFELLKPHFLAKASLSPEDARFLREGQLVWTRLQSEDTRPLWQSVREWGTGVFRNLIAARA